MGVDDSLNSGNNYGIKGKVQINRVEEFPILERQNKRKNRGIICNNTAKLSKNQNKEFKFPVKLKRRILFSYIVML